MNMHEMTRIDKYAWEPMNMHEMARIDEYASKQ